MRYCRGSLVWLPVFLLCACAELPFFSSGNVLPAAPPDYPQHLERLQAVHAFAVNGRMGVVTEKKGFSGAIYWYHAPETDEISLYSPFGAKVGQISVTAEGVTLVTEDQKTYTASDAETLTRNTLGWGLPLSGLPDWALGRPAKGSVQIQGWYQGGLIARMQQQGWNIEYLSYRDSQGLKLPGRIVLKSEKVDLKLIVESWQTDVAPPVTPE